MCVGAYSSSRAADASAVVVDGRWPNTFEQAEDRHRTDQGVADPADDEAGGVDALELAVPLEREELGRLRHRASLRRRRSEASVFILAAWTRRR